MTRLLIVGEDQGTHLGGSFLHAAVEMGIEASLLRAGRASGRSALLHRVSWHLLGRRPAQLARFGRELVRWAVENRTEVLLTMGIAPLGRSALEQLGRAGIVRLNYLTDDPWNPAQHASWFLRALPGYDCVFTPREANIAQLRKLGCARVERLPFGYDPTLFFHEPLREDLQSELGSELLFVGGADADRKPILRQLAAELPGLILYGGYWNRDPLLRPHWRGMASPAVLRRATAAAQVNLCLLRRANRDGHVMRSFEIPASGGCMLAEDSSDHREFFGAEGDCVFYFRDTGEILAKTRQLLADTSLREVLRTRLHARVAKGHHRYRDRLHTMLATAKTLR